MQTKQVSYHKGKNLFFVSYDLDIFSSSTLCVCVCVFCCFCMCLSVQAPVMLCVCAMMKESCTFALRVMNIAQEVHYGNELKRTRRDDVKLAKKNKQKKTEFITRS